ncbi:MAG: hypothetical protein ABEJ80_05600 [Halarchaeum sp.]
MTRRPPPARRPVESDGSERAVSDVVGFVLVFSLITITVALVYTSGVGSLQDARTAEQLDNAQMAFDVLQSNVADVVNRGSPARSTTIRLSAATLRAGDPVTVNVSSANGSVSRDVTPLVYELDGTEIVYVDGALLRAQGGNAAMLAAPNAHFGDVALVPLVDTYVPGSAAVGGGRTLVTARVADPERRQVDRYDEAPFHANVTTTRPGPWERYFDGRCANVTTVAAGARTTVSCRLNASTVVVQRTAVRVTFR